MAEAIPAGVRWNAHLIHLGDKPPNTITMITGMITAEYCYLNVLLLLYQYGNNQGYRIRSFVDRICGYDTGYEIRGDTESNVQNLKKSNQSRLQQAGQGQPQFVKDGPGKGFRSHKPCKWCDWYVVA